VLGAGCGLLLAPLAVVGLRGAVSDDGVRVTTPAMSAPASPSVSPSVTPGKMRVVTPGERVVVAPGTKIWLTADGMHWAEPDAPTQFQSVTDGNIAMSEPGVTLRSSGRGDGTRFLFGIYHGNGEAARVRIETTEGVVEGTALTLAGSPRWGVWYAMTKSPRSAQANDALMNGGVHKVTVYDAAGGVIASLDLDLMR
jgi:hypothetical protein